MKDTSNLTIIGEIVSAHENSLTARFPHAAIGDLCWAFAQNGTRRYGQIMSFRENLFSVALFEGTQGICPRAPIRTQRRGPLIAVGMELLGQVISPLGVPLARSNAAIQSSALRLTSARDITARPPQPSERPIITEKLETGVRAIDAFCTLGYGQRIGIFASAGVGKSTLLATIARQASVDVTVVALVGERSREVKEFIHDTLGPTGLARSVVVVATSDDSSLMRQTAPYTATAIAEYFRDQGKRVLLIVDSLTRMARALRETGIAAGELPVRHGYTNSVYTRLPQLIERAGTSQQGSITAIYTVLTNQEDDIDPLADEIKSLLDGHIVLRRELATMGIHPAVDITQSISRLFNRLHPQEYTTAAQKVVIATHRLLKERDIVLLGGVPDPALQRILDHQDQILGVVKQPLDQRCRAEESEQVICTVARLVAGQSVRGL